MANRRTKQKVTIEATYLEALLLYLIHYRPLQICAVLLVLAMLARWIVGDC